MRIYVLARNVHSTSRCICMTLACFVSNNLRNWALLSFTKWWFTTRFRILNMPYSTKLVLPMMAVKHCHYWHWLNGNSPDSRFLICHTLQMYMYSNYLWYTPHGWWQVQNSYNEKVLTKKQGQYHKKQVSRFQHNALISLDHFIVWLHKGK